MFFTIDFRVKTIIEQKLTSEVINMVKEYTQVVQPVSRVPEKIFGWIGWIALLALTAYLAFFSLFTARDPQFMESIRMNAQDAVQGTDLTVDEFMQVIEAITQNFWLAAVILLIPLIIAFFGLIKMRKRILAGILLLIAAIIIAPFVITLFSSLMFVIAAILLFARKDKVITQGATNEYINRRPDYARDNYDRNDRSIKQNRNDFERDVEDHNQEELNRIRNRNESHNQSELNRVQDERDDYDDLEKTRQFSAVDENLKSQDVDYPVTDEEYNYDTEDAARTRRENVDRRNNDDL